MIICWFLLAWAKIKKLNGDVCFPEDDTIKEVEGIPFAPLNVTREIPEYTCLQLHSDELLVSF